MLRLHRNLFFSRIPDRDIRTQVILSLYSRGRRFKSDCAGTSGMYPARRCHGINRAEDERLRSSTPPKPPGSHYASLLCYPRTQYSADLTNPPCSFIYQNMSAQHVIPFRKRSHYSQLIDSPCQHHQSIHHPLPPLQRAFLP
jgi:hypothetical protein